MPTSSDSKYPQASATQPLILKEQGIENAFIEKLRSLKYIHRPDIRDRDTLEKNFREQFEALNRVQLTDGEFLRLLDEIKTPDVFTAARTLLKDNADVKRGFRDRRQQAFFPHPRERQCKPTCAVQFLNN